MKENPSGMTQYAQNQWEDSLDNNAGWYENMVEQCGQEKVDELVDGIGMAELERLNYGVGQSNMIAILNVVSPTSRLITLVGNDYASPAT